MTVFRSLIFAGRLLCLMLPGVPSSAQVADPPPAGELTGDARAALARALDKITARITELRLPVGEEMRFGSLVITARQCISRPPEETPESSAFLEIDEETEAGRRRVFTGWMFASSPALNSLEHPVFDVWIIGCEDDDR